MGEGVGLLERIDEAVAAADAELVEAKAGLPPDAPTGEAAIDQDPIPPDAITVTPEDQKHNPVTARFLGTLGTARVAGVMQR